MHSTHNPLPITHHLSEKHTFSSKERDVETGLSYFGARYYSSDLSIWLSVDPMSGKYPSLSPYVYCADNPVKLVDPNGEDVYITGDEWELAFRQLQSSTNLTLKRDPETGKISCFGEELTDSDRKLQSALVDNNVIVRITAKDVNDVQGLSFNGGAHMGTSISNDGKVNSYQVVNPLLLAGIDFYSNFTKNTYDNGMECISYAGDGSKDNCMLHEVTEAYFAGKISLQVNTDIHPATRGSSTYSLYEQAHNQATPQPNSNMVTSESIRQIAHLMRCNRILKK